MSRTETYIFHACERDKDDDSSDGMCLEDDKGNMRFSIESEYGCNVNFCPYCGREATKKVEYKVVYEDWR